MAFALVAATQVAAEQTTFEGVVDSSSGHDGTLWTVTLKNRTTVVLPSEPVSDYENGEVPRLATIRVTCTLARWRANNLVVDCTDLSPVTVLETQSADASDFKVLALTGEKTTGVSYAFTMALVDIPGCFSQNYTVQLVKDVMAESNDLISSCSYGQMSIDLKQLQVKPVNLTCTRSLTDAMLSCDYNVLRALAVEALGSPTGKVGSLHLGMVLPQGSSCKWAALANVGGPFTWYKPEPYGIGRAGTVVQELLHNFGLFHSSKDSGTCTCHGQASFPCHSEYGDFSTPMGRGDACLNAPEAYRINWATAIASLDASSLPAGTSASYTLPPAHTTSNNMVIVKPTWVAPYLENLYFSLRVKAGADAKLDNAFNGVVSFHTTNQAIDAVSSNRNLGTHFETTIKPDSEYVITNYKLVVTTGPLAADKTISLTLCRYGTSKSECGARPPPSPPPPAAKDCGDEDVDNCPYWQEQGFCAATSIYAPYMKDNCAKSCGLCAKCVDSGDVCSTYVSQVGCTGNGPIYDYLKQYCPKSCKTCASSAAATLAAGQQCVDLSSSCDVLKEELTCNPSTEKAAIFMKANCQKTCELCPVLENGASIANQLPLGCAANYDITGAKTINTTKGLDVNACWQLCYDTEGCYLFSHDAKRNSCVLRTTLRDAVASTSFKLVTRADHALCVVGSDSPSTAPTLLQWFYCTDGLDIAGSLVSIQTVKTELECAQACNATAACRLYTLVGDDSCILKSDPFSGDLGTNDLGSSNTKSCIQTFYTNPSSSSSRRRRAMATGQPVPRSFKRRLMAGARKDWALPTIKVAMVLMP